MTTAVANAICCRSPRISRLRDRVMARRGSWVAGANPFALDAALYRVPAGLSVAQTRARMLAELVEATDIAIYDDWQLAGEHLRSEDMGWGVHRPDWRDNLQRLAQYGLTPDCADELTQRVDRWNQRADMGIHYGEDDPEVHCGQGQWGDGNCFWARGWTENHSVPGYARVLKYGFAGLKRQVERRLARARLTDKNYVTQENFWRAALYVCDAGMALGRRYSERAAQMAAEAADPDDKARLERMAATCRRVPAQPARTLLEATQALWFAHILKCGEDTINANSIGRLDQILQPYYAADLDAGRCTRGDALELMEELACKLYLDYDVQAITLGGQDAAGQSAVNDMSRLILEATANVDFIRDVSVRLTDDMPEDFLRQCAENVARGGGIPFFFNDDCFIPALTDRGVKLADARDYAPIGCIELTIPGQANPHAVSGWINAAKWLELALFDGRDPRTGEQTGPRTGLLTDMADYDDLLGAYTRQMTCLTDRMVYLCNRGETAQREWGPLPCWSLLTDNCIARGRDITDGGARYLYHSICLLGTANTADSLMAIKKLVFEERKVSAAELLDALRADFDGCESLRQMLLRSAPKYGNDAREVDEIAAWVTNVFIDLLDGYRSPLGGRYFAHLFSFKCNIDFGLSLGATPDGRQAGQPIAYSLSAQQGRDEHGVGAMLNSLSRLPHHRAAGASAAIVDLDPKLVAGPAGVERLVQILRAAQRLRVGQLQLNVVTVERLRQAQADPERYGNIPVRVAGYSQKFRLIEPRLQEHIIARTKHAQ